MVQNKAPGARKCAQSLKVFQIVQGVKPNLENEATVRHFGQRIIDMMRVEAATGTYIILNSMNLSFNALKDRSISGVLNQNAKDGKPPTFDRIVPLPHFSYKNFPFAFLNDTDVVDLQTGDLVSTVKYKNGGVQAA